MLVVSVFLFFKKWPIHKLFVVFSLISGIVFAVILPPSTDEWAHFNRAYSISEGNIVLPSKGDTTGSYIPSSLRDLNAYYKDLYSWQKGLEEELNQNDKVFVAFPNSGVYSPVPYLSQSIGILFGRFLDLSPLIVFIISRIMNLVSWAVLLYFAIKRIPYGKSLIFGLALLPISIETAASCSADALLFASSFLLIAEILNIYHNPIKRIEKDNIKLLAVIICIIALCKPGFCLLALLLFVIPSQYYGSGKKYVYTNTLILASGGILTLLWTLLVGKSSDALAVWMQNIYGPGIDSKEQLINVLRDPTVFVKATIHAIDGEKQLYYWQMFLKTWVTPYAPTLFMIIYSFVFILSLIFESDPIRDTISIRGKSIMVGVFLLISMAIYGIFYLTITPVGALGIKGTQGRYFIPLLPVLLLTVKSKWSISVKSSDVLLANLLFYISFFGVLYSMLSYYLIYK
nr:DUF2142 domain-containing protein [Cohnella thailandensis]